jgi:hypothetical protein
VEGHDYSDPEAIIRLFPSIPMSIDRNALDEAITMLGNKDNDGAEDDSEEGEEA